MKEVSTPTAALLLDALERRGFDPWTVWSGLDVSPSTFRDRGQRIDWDVWVEMMARAEVAAGGPASMELLFLPGAGARTGHPFVRLAKSFLTLSNTYELFARWGIPRTLLVASARFTQEGHSRASFELDIDPSRAGSLPLVRFVAGILRNLPVLLGLAEAEVRIDPASTPHHGRYTLLLPHEASMLGRARRVVGLFGGASAALEELELQSSEISTQNRELREKVSELERTTTSLQQQDAWLELALDAGKLGLWRLEMDTQRMSWSPGAAKIVGITGPTEGEGAGVAWSERIHPDDREEVTRSFQEAVAAGRPIELSYRVPQPDGTSRWVAAKGRVHYGPDGRPSHALGTVADVTEHKSIETKLRFADRMISAGTLAAGVAHEINNPLMYVMATVELLRESASAGKLDAEGVNETLADLFDGLGRIRDVVAADLRSFARPEEEHVELTPIGGMCERALRVVSPAVRHRAQVSTDFKDDGARVHVNASRMGQVLTNLILNASQAMPDRPVVENRIMVRTRAEGDTVTIEIEDNGAGIAPEVLPRLFDPFFTTKARGIGTGLGLSVCQSIVNAHQGRLEVETVLGRGTMFRVLLPRGDAGEAFVEAPSPVRAPRPSAPHSARVLVVDDEPMLRKTLTRLLEAAGLVVSTAEGTRAALALPLEDFDVILCDVMMPDGSGEDLYHALEARGPGLTDKVILMSGGAVTPKARDFCGRVDRPLLMKPFTVDAALEAIRRLSQARSDA